MRSFVLSVLMVLCGVSAAWCEELRIGGTGAGLALSHALAEAFLQGRPGDTLWIPESLGTSGGVRALAAAKLDVAVLMRPLKADEMAGGVSFGLCRTPWAFYVQKNRDDVRLASADLTGLFLSSLPGFAKGEVRPLLRPGSETGFIKLQEYYPHLVPLIEQARGARGAVMVLSDQEAMDAVENGPALVGFGAYAPLLAEHRPLRVVVLDGRDPAALAPDYPFWAEIYMATGPQNSVLGRAFVEYVKSSAAAKVLRANGCVAMSGNPS